MPGFNSKEKRISNSLSRIPGLKTRIKKLYSFLNYSIYKKNYKYRSDHTVINSGSSYSDSFFGYYDKSPVNISETHTVFQMIDHDGLEIILKDNITAKNTKSGTSSAFSLQQGSRLMWLNENEFIFNDSLNENYISRIYNALADSTRTVNMPVYDCFKDEFALSVNFTRLKATDSDYGYGKALAYKQLPCTDIDGIFFVDLKQNTSKLLVSFENVFGLYEKFPENAKHCFNHIMISPDGKNFIFIHRWFVSGKRSEALILSDISGNTRILSDHGFVSHCCWNGNDEIIGYLEDPSHGRTFYRMDIHSGNTELLSQKLIGYGDGHPSVQGNRMLFDSYPDRSRMQHLYVYDMEKDKIDELGSFLSPMKFFGQNRCDLHPRWSPDGRSVYFDSVHEGIRQLYRMDLNA